MTLEQLLADIHALEEDLLAFERKYGVRSETFFAAYQNGEEPEDDSWMLDFGEWASVYRTYLARQAEYRNEVQRRRKQQAPSLAGLVRVAGGEGRTEPMQLQRLLLATPTLSEDDLQGFAQVRDWMSRTARPLHGISPFGQSPDKLEDDLANARRASHPQ